MIVDTQLFVCRMLGLLVAEQLKSYLRG